MKTWIRWSSESMASRGIMCTVAIWKKWEPLKRCSHSQKCGQKKKKGARNAPASCSLLLSLPPTTSNPLWQDPDWGLDVGVRTELSVSISPTAVQRVRRKGMHMISIDCMFQEKKDYFSWLLIYFLNMPCAQFIASAQKYLFEGLMMPVPPYMYSYFVTHIHTHIHNVISRISDILNKAFFFIALCLKKFLQTQFYSLLCYIRKHTCLLTFKVQLPEMDKTR